jgi:hypothetical protein
MTSVTQIKLRRWYRSVISALYTKLAGTPRDEKIEALLAEGERLSNENIRLARLVHLLEDCTEYDIDLSGYDDIWERDEHGHFHLNAKGRATARKLLHDEKELRFENTARWVKLLVPIITGIAGLLGIITGLVAVLQHKK